MHMAFQLGPEWQSKASQAMEPSIAGRGTASAKVQGGKRTVSKGNKNRLDDWQGRPSRAAEAKNLGSGKPPATQVVKQTTLWGVQVVSDLQESG